jgi:two-component system response regulator CiaR
MENRNMIVHKQKIFQNIWGFYCGTGSSVVEVYASQIRKELKKHEYVKYF